MPDVKTQYLGNTTHNTHVSEMFRDIAVLFEGLREHFSVPSNTHVIVCFCL